MLVESNIAKTILVDEKSNFKDFFVPVSRDFNF